jgi:hypothetical protein
MLNEGDLAVVVVSLNMGLGLAACRKKARWLELFQAPPNTSKGQLL